MYQPTFKITNTILKNVGLIEGAREVIVHAPLVPAWEAKFREEAIIRTVHHGTHIEGNELNFTEAAKILQVKDVQTPSQAAQRAGVVGRDRDIQEVINYRNVLRFIDDYQILQQHQKDDEEKKIGENAAGEVQESLGKLKGIPEAVVKHLHKLTVEHILAPNQCGTYRETQVVVKNSITGEITFRPPPAVEIPYLMEEFVHWINATSPDDMHPVLKAGICQYELVRVHPFLDGNGRVARALAVLVLFIDGYDIRKFFSLEEYYDRDASHYYEALQSVASPLAGGSKDDGADLTPWLGYFTQGLAIELNRVKEKVRGLSTDIHLKEKLGGEQIFLSERQIKIVEYLQKAGFLQNRAFNQLFPMVSEDTILRDLKSLLDRGLVKKEGVTKAARYVLVK